MLFVVYDTNEGSKVLLVRAENSGEVEQRLSLSETQKVVGAFTSEEQHTLETSSFVVISA